MKSSENADLILNSQQAKNMKNKNIYIFDAKINH
jgi:hypothetical protein